MSRPSRRRTSNLGNVLQEQGKLSNAIAAYRQAISLRPNLAVAHANLATALKVSGSFDQAVVSYRQAIAIGPTLSAAHYNLSTLLLMLGRLQEAEQSAERAVQMALSNARYLCNLAVLKRFDDGIPYLKALEQLANRHDLLALATRLPFILRSQRPMKI